MPFKFVVEIQMRLLICFVGIKKRRIAKQYVFRYKMKIKFKLPIKSIVFQSA